ncbi:hypothetical protein [Flexivirga oryzae]|uniref:Uncharacterized protein n=1 Tax=Flexivirga oryzae TaxID=1794944 RepID=A0A839NBW6_9MICO|nr:hypothetical protein [Flexivirga oryzae]MBB2893743.1 hypothetical protein [Flexivirga oryzae]
MTVHGWPWPRTRVDPERDHAVVADGVGIVVRDGDHVVWVRPDGCTTARVDEDLALSAADPTTAWFVDWSHIDPGEPPAPAPPLPPGRIVAIHNDGTRTDIPTPTAEQSIVVRGDDVWVTTSDPSIAHPTRYGWHFEYPTSVLRFGRKALLDKGMAAGVPSSSRPVANCTGRREDYWVWLEEDAELIFRYGEPAGGLKWWAGSPDDEGFASRRVLAVGHEPETGGEVVTADLVLGLVNSAQAIGDELWVAVARAPARPVTADYGVDVLAVAADGVTSALSDGLSAPSVTVEGDWPDTRIVVMFRHTRRPGLLLRRTLPVFDEEGRPVDHEYPDIYLMEDLDTGHLAPAEDAVDGILDT